MGHVPRRPLLLRDAVRLLTGTAAAAAAAGAGRSRLAGVRRLTWLGQTAASIFWISSMLISGLDSPGAWLQLCAASAWLLANIATFVTARADR